MIDTSAAWRFVGSVERICLGVMLGITTLGLVALAAFLAALLLQVTP